LKVNIFAYRRKLILSYQSMFKEFVDKLINTYDRKISIVLFGSRGRGDNKESSDFDVMIVLRKKTINDYQRAYQLKPVGLPADVIIVTPDELNNQIIKQMLVGSKIIYDGLNCFKEE